MAPGMHPNKRKLKMRVRRALVKGPLRPLAARTFHALIAAELAVQRRLTGRRSDPFDLGEVTAIIKTFERPERCQALIDSIRVLHPDLRIVVVDDSREPRQFAAAETLVLPFDSGVSAGRNLALGAVATPYVLNLDDDLMFFRGTRLAAAMALLRGLPQVDIMGGVMLDLPHYGWNHSLGGPLHPTSARAKLPAGTRIGPLTVADKVSNFFLARTAAVRSIGWDPLVRRLDHADFFTRAKGRLVSAYNPALQVLHVKDPFAADYRRFRFDIAPDLAYLKDKFGEPSPLR